MSYPQAHHYVELMFKEEIPHEKREEILDDIFKVGDVRIEQSGLDAWIIDGDFRDDTLEKVLDVYVNFFENTEWMYDFEQETSFIRIHDGKLERCGVMPDGKWNKITFEEETENV